MALIDVPAETFEGTERATGEPRVVLCGSFRRDRRGLLDAFRSLAHAGCDLLSPVSLDFVSEVDGFVRTEAEAEETVAVVEGSHLSALRGADFVWLHCPDGYVGTSGALEVGVAHSLDVPVYAAERPSDVTLAEYVMVAANPVAAADEVRGLLRTPVAPLRDLQSYYGRKAAERGFDSESVQDTMLLLTEEVGELARAIRKAVGLARAGSGEEDPAAELADVQLYILHLANVIGVDLAQAVSDKEKVNEARYGRAAA